MQSWILWSSLQLNYFWILLTEKWNCKISRIINNNPNGTVSQIVLHSQLLLQNETSSSYLKLTFNSSSNIWNVFVTYSESVLNFPGGQHVKTQMFFFCDVEVMSRTYLNSSVRANEQSWSWHCLSFTTNEASR